MVQMNLFSESTWRAQAVGISIFANSVVCLPDLLIEKKKTIGTLNLVQAQPISICNVCLLYFSKKWPGQLQAEKKNCGIAWVPAYLLDCVEWQLDQNMFFKQNYPFNLSTCRNFQVIEVKFKHNDCISQQRHISVLFFVQCRELIYSISRITPHDH